MQKLPDLDLVEHEGDLICDECNKEATFLLEVKPIDGPVGDGKFRCKDCFSVLHPGIADELTAFSTILDLLLEAKSRRMSLDEMYELYGNKEDG